MCGILFVTGATIAHFEKRLKTLQPRGPDETTILVSSPHMFGHTRLCITNVLEQSQPTKVDEYILLFNGEIYEEGDGIAIIDSIKKHGMTPAAVQNLCGIFAFVCVNTTTGEIFIARDRNGVIPLYLVETADSLVVASELKALYDLDAEPTIFPPGYCINTSTENGLQPYHQWSPTAPTVTAQLNKGYLHKLISNAVDIRIPKEVPWGVLLSGGLDSSIIAALVLETSTLANFRGMHTFSIGLEGSPDLKYAKELSKWLNSNHVEVIYTPQEGISVLKDVIYAIETYDVTTIRASVPMYLLAQKIKRFGIKVILSGEGSDELFGGYLYNHFCSNPDEMHKECVLKMSRLHYHDCLRANKSMACWGIETRVPFLDNKVTDYAMHVLDPTEKLSHEHPSGKKMEKWTLRETFNYLPDYIKDREKVQFSDGVGDKWIQALQEHAGCSVTDAQMEKRKETFDFQTPQTKEAYLYRKIFTELFGQKTEKTVFYNNNTTACSSENAFKWNDDFKPDPSAKLLTTTI